MFVGEAPWPSSLPPSPLTNEEAEASLWGASQGASSCPPGPASLPLGHSFGDVHPLLAFIQQEILLGTGWKLISGHKKPIFPLWVQALPSNPGLPEIEQPSRPEPVGPGSELRGEGVGLIGI